MLPLIFQDIDRRIDAIELWRLDVTTQRHFSFGTWHNRQHVFMKVASDGQQGWGEVLAAKNNPKLDIAPWGACFGALHGLTIPEALDGLSARRQDVAAWSVDRLELAEMALLDLAGRVSGKPTIKLLGLPGRDPVSGLFCVLEEDPHQAMARAAVALARKLSTHVKIKIFGNPDLDGQLVRAVRQVVGTKAFLVADANCGYKCDARMPIEELAGQLRALRQAGLDACEDPARVDARQWIALQQQVGDLALLVDYPARPAWAAMETLLPGMGRIYNLHPGCMGSLLETAALSRKIQGWGARVMVGDDSLIGPACTAWQQMAIGMGAAWVEALEKPDESDLFLQCVSSQATSQQADGRFGIGVTKAGFGLEVDEVKLRQLCTQHCLCGAATD